MSSNGRFFVVASLVVLPVLGCAGPSNDPVLSAPRSCPSSTEQVQAQILQPSCGNAGCHGGVQAALGLDLVSSGLLNRIVGTAANGCGDEILVTAGDPAHSYLLDKLTSATPSCGDRMPLGAPALSSADVACLRDWISSLTPTADGGADSGTPGSGGTNGTAGTGGQPGTASGGTTVTGGSSGSGGQSVTASGGTMATGPSTGGQFGSGTGGQAAAGAGGTIGSSGGTTSSGGAVASGGVGGAIGWGGVTASGGATGTGACGPAVSFAGQVQPVFTASCASAGCHTGNRPAASLSLASGAAFAALVNVPSSSCGSRLRVKPAAVSASYLVDKLLGTNLCSGTQMPKAGSGLPAAQLSAITGWICQGAPNN